MSSSIPMMLERKEVLQSLHRVSLAVMERLTRTLGQRYEGSPCSRYGTGISLSTTETMQEHFDVK